MTSLEAYAAAFANLNPNNLSALLEQVSDDIYFVDPFNKVTGKDKLQHIMLDMFEQLDEARFEITAVMPGNPGHIQWIFHAKSNKLGTVEIDGLSQVSVNSEGKICRHIDYWDASLLFQNIPILGWMLKAVKKRLSIA